MPEELRRYELAVPRDRQFHAGSAAVLIERLKESIAKLEQWQVRVADLGRLRTALRVLQAVVDAGRYSTRKHDLQDIAEAVVLASDFYKITQALGNEQSERIAKELQRMLAGTLTAQEKQRTPYQFQAQFFVGAILCRGGISPGVPDDTRKNPDFLLPNGTLLHGIEVKRPAALRGVTDLLRSARDQLRAAGVRGFIAMDVSDCLRDAGLRKFSNDPEEQSFGEVRPQYEDLAKGIHHQLWNEDRQDYWPGFECVLGTWIFARGWRWLEGDYDAPQIFGLHSTHV